MDLDLAKQWTSHWEGVRNVTYTDTVGKPTIGIGLNLATPAAQNAITALGLDFNSVLSGATSLTSDQIDQLFQGSLALALVTARNLVPNFDQLPENQQIVITDLAFNMGQPTLAAFTGTLKSISLQDWPGAAANLQNSKWFNEVGSKPNERGGANVAVLGGTTVPQTILGII